MRHPSGLDSSFSLQVEVSSFLRVQEALVGHQFSPETASALLATFNLIWREAVAENGAHNVDDRRRICVMAADAVISFAKAGLQPEQIRRFARSNIRFMTTSREAAAVM